MTIWLGTAGYSYATWVGGIYPLGTPAARYFGYYSREFPAVELNNTFYRCPTPAQLVRQAEKAPPGFRFSVKLPATISHGLRRDELPQFRAAVAALKNRGRLP